MWVVDDTTKHYTSNHPMDKEYLFRMMAVNGITRQKLSGLEIPELCSLAIREYKKLYPHPNNEISVKRVRSMLIKILRGDILPEGKHYNGWGSIGEFYENERRKADNDIKEV
jgi:hypothetical protein